MTSTHDIARAGSPAALLAVIPHLLGFTPESSLVVIGISTETGQVGVTMRYDLPDPACSETAAGIAQHAVAVLTAQQLTTAVAAGYGPDHLVRPLANALTEESRRHDVQLRDVLRVHEDRYWSYACSCITCCPPGGKPLDTADDPAVTAITARTTVLASRAALAGTLAPVSGTAAQAMREATARAEKHISTLLARHSRIKARARIAGNGLAAVTGMIGLYRDGRTCRSDYRFAWLSVALRDLRIRDDAWARMDPAHGPAHLRLWTDLTRRAQPGYIAAPASLLAFTAWQQGNGALANIALDRALADDRAYSMAGLLRDALNAGAPPSLATLPMTPEQVAEEYDACDPQNTPDCDPAGADDMQPQKAAEPATNQPLT